VDGKALLKVGADELDGVFVPKEYVELEMIDFR
jgi:hypothetical protein